MKSLKFALASIIVLTSSAAWADLIRKSDKTPCSPTVHFKIPDSWFRAYITTGGKSVEMREIDKNRWATISFADLTTENDSSFFFSVIPDAPCYFSNYCVTTKGVNAVSQNTKKDGFSCETFGDKDNAEVWIQEHPDIKKAGQLYITNTKPVVKNLFVLLPQNTTWHSSTPLIQEDGKDHELYPSEECGWFYRRYIDEDLPKTVLIHRNDDETLSEAIGINGSWETNTASPDPIPMKSIFELYNSSDSVYFVADDDLASALPSESKGWSNKLPNVTGKCTFELPAIIYDTDASLHGAFTCDPNWSMLTEGTDLGKANVCYTPDAKYPIVASDSVAVPCIGITKGMVESTLAFDAETNTKKMKLTEIGKKCFGSTPDEAFKAMFTATSGINEKYIVNLPFYRNYISGKWEFDSDYYTSPGAKAQGGFYPAEEPPAEPAMLSERLPAAESKRKAEGPTFFCTDELNPSTKTPLGLRTIDEKEGARKSELICNGPGWEGGIDCDGLFLSGSELWNGATTTEIGKLISEKLDVTWYETGWGWSCETFATPVGWPKYKDGSETPVNGSQGGSHRWMSTDGKNYDDSRILTDAGRNQHFCFEIHSTFIYKHGLKLSISGDDDIWAFIDNKLAIDIGGMHLPAPGYVDLDKFMPNATVGKSYDFDVYACDRRTTMTTFRMNTNIFFEQAASEVIPCCTDLIETSNISFLLSTDSTGKDPSKVIINEEEFKTNPIQLGGGIDVSNKTSPTTNIDKISGVLAPGKYYFIIKVDSNKKVVPITVRQGSRIPSKKAIASNTFRVSAIAPLELEITQSKNAAKQYAIMDMKGQVLSVGALNGASTRVKLASPGSYIVKAGKNIQRVNIK